MKDTPRFLIAHNVAAEPEGLYLIHTKTPSFIAKCIPHTGEIIPVDELCKNYPAGARTNRINGTYYIIVVLRFFDQYDANMLPKLMSRTGDWFYSYIKSLPNDDKRSF